MDGYLSERIGLPLLASGQAGKEATHNEALATIDIALQASVVAIGLNAAPAAPQPGECWIVGAAPTGGWTGHAHAIAGWTAGGWRFVAPFDGLSAWCRAAGRTACFTGGAWRDGVVSASRIEVDGTRVVAARQPAVPAPEGGAVIDVQARAAIATLLDRLAAHGLIAP